MLSHELCVLVLFCGLHFASIQLGHTEAAEAIGLSVSLIELFAGVQEVTLMFRSVGLPAAALDLTVHRKVCDLLTPAGMACRADLLFLATEMTCCVRFLNSNLAVCIMLESQTLCKGSFRDLSTWEVTTVWFLFLFAEACSLACLVLPHTWWPGCYGTGLSASWSGNVRFTCRLQLLFCLHPSFGFATLFYLPCLHAFR